MKSPFKFLDAYVLQDKKVFFGRDNEVNALYKMVFESPLILVYGFMGTGKTSVIKCGLASKFDGPDWYPFYIRRQHDINDSLATALHQASRSANGTSMTALQRVDFIYKTYFRPVYLIFDQFEELFILGDEAEQQKFIQTVKSLVESDVPCKVILVMREEYLGNLYHFEKELPYIFDFKLRVEKMGNKTVKKVISDSFLEFNIQMEAPVEERLDQMMDKVSLGKSGIQLPYLQVYMDLFYKEDFERTYPGKERQEGEYPELLFSKNEIEEFGAIDQVLEKFLNEQKVRVSAELLKEHPSLNEETISTVLNAFVSDEGTKRPVSYTGAGEYFSADAEFRSNIITLSNQELYDALRALEHARIIRFTDDTIELAHDTLAAIIHGKRSHEELKLKDIRIRLKNSYKTYKETEEVLSEKMIIYYEDYLSDLNPPPEILDFIEASKAEIQNQKQKERKKLIKWIMAMAAFSVVALGLAITSIIFYNTSEKRGSELKTNLELSDIISNLYTKVSKAFQTTKSDRTNAYIETKKVLAKAHSINKANPVAYQLQNDLFKEVTYFPFYKNKIPSRKNIVKASVLTVNDSLHYLLSLPKGSKEIKLQMLDQDFNVRPEKAFHISSKDEIINFEFFKEEQELMVASNNIIQIWSLKDSFHIVREIDLKYKIYCLERSRKANELYVGTEMGLHRVIFNVKNRKRKPIIRWMKQFKNPIALITSNTSNNIIAFSEQYSDKVFIINRDSFNSTSKKYPLDTLQLKGVSVQQLDFSNAGNFLAIAYDNSRAGIYKLTKEKLKLDFELIGHESVINSIGYSPDGQFILTGSQNGKAVVWNKYGEPLKKLVGHENAIYDATYIDNEYVLTVGEDDNMKVWNVKSLAEKSYDLNDKVTHLSFSPDGKTIIASCKDQIGTVNVIQFDEHEEESLHMANKEIDSLAQPLKNPGDKPGLIRSLFYTSDNYIVMGSSNHLTTLMKISDAKNYLDFRSDKKPDHGMTRTRCVAVSEKLVAIGDGFSGIILRERDGGAFLPKNLKHRWMVNALVFSKDGKKLIAGYTDGLILIWGQDSEGEFNVIDTLSKHTGRISSLALSTENDLLVSGSYDNTAIVWEKDKNGEYKFKQQLTGHLSDVNAVDISTDSIDLVLTASGDRTVKLWKRNGDRENNHWDEEPSFISHLSGINTAAFDPKGKHVATGSNDKTLKIWNIHNPDKILDQRIYKE